MSKSLKEKRKIAFGIGLLCIAFATVYFYILSLESASGKASMSVITQVYAYADTALLFLFIILNLGFSNKEMTADMFSCELSREEAQKRADKINKNKKIARVLLYFIIPITFTLFADIMILFWGDSFMGLVKAVIGTKA